MFAQPGQASWASLPSQGQQTRSPPAMYGHSTVCVKESAWGGPLLVTFGGTTGEGANSQVDSLWIWHESTGWKNVVADGPSPPPRGFHAAAVSGSLMYIFGGNRWEKLAPPAKGAASPPGRAESSVRVVYDDFWVLDTVSMKWQQITPPMPSSICPSARSAAGLACLPSGDVLLYGGKSTAAPPSNSPLFASDLWCYHPDTSTWESITMTGPVPRPRALPTFLPADQGVYLYGGMDERQTPLGDLWLLSTSGPALEWIDCKRPCPSGGHSGHCAALANGCYYVVWGGKVPDPRISLFEKFDPVMSGVLFVLNLSDPKGKWTALPARDIEGVSQPEPRVWASMCEVQPGELLIQGGMNGRDIFSTCHLLKLPIETPARPCVVGSKGRPSLGEASPPPGPASPAGRPPQTAPKPPPPVGNLIDLGGHDVPGAAASPQAPVLRSVPPLSPPSPVAQPPQQRMPPVSSAQPLLKAPAPVAPGPRPGSLFSSITDAFKSTVTSIGSVGSETASALTNLRGGAFSGRSADSPTATSAGVKPAEVSQLTYPPRPTARPPHGLPSPTPAPPTPPKRDTVAAWLAGNASPPPSTSCACVLVPLSDPFAKPANPRASSRVRSSTPVSVTPPATPATPTAAAPTDDAATGDDAESGPSSPVSEWISLHGGASVTPRDHPAQSPNSAQRGSDGRAGTSEDEGGGLTVSRSATEDDEDDVVDGLVDMLVAEVHDAEPYGYDGPGAAASLDSSAFFDFGTEARAPSVLESTWPPLSTPSPPRSRFREVGREDKGSAGLQSTPPLAGSPTSSKAAADEPFESAEVSGILEANPLHSLGLRLLSRQSARLEFVSVDEARDATGSAATKWLLSAPSMEALRLKDVDALLQEYRRLAPLGALSALKPGGGGGRGHCSGHLAHLGSQELRLRDVQVMLQEYRMLHSLANGTAR